jgi:cytochrome c-type biogenesis protein CcsB
MKKILPVLFSFQLMGAVLFIFAVSIGVATFIESRFDSNTARAVVYNARWFEALLFLGIINITGIIIQRKLYKKGTLSLFIFHLAFVIILLGSAVTRFLGFEGVMHIRENDSQNQIFSNKTYFSASADIMGTKVEKSKEVLFSAFSENHHTLVLNSDEKKIRVECTGIIPNAVEVAKVIPNGSPMLDIVIAGLNGRQNASLENGETKNLQGINISFNDSSNTQGVNITLNNSGMFVQSPFELVTIDMGNQSQEILSANTLYPFNIKMLYSINDVQFIATNFYPSAEIDVISDPEDNNSFHPTAVKIKVTVENQSHNLVYVTEENSITQPLKVTFNEVDFIIQYGPRAIHLPFYLKLDEFILEHYPGSMSPSWFESKITLIDSVNALSQQRRIFMNNVMQYKGYRFYQSSYDNDEMGTVLSVNHDFWGTVITYLGYLLMSLGMILSLFIRKSQFRALSRHLTELREKKKHLKTSALVLLFAFLPAFSANSQDMFSESMLIPQEQAKTFGKVLVQDPGGRIKPLNSLSSELLRKISRKTSFMGQSGDQIILGMLTFPEYWQSIPIIKASHPEIMKALGTNEKLVSFNSLFSRDHGNQYILQQYVQEAYNKKPASRSKFDNEIIRLDERVNLCYIIFTHEILRIFPKPDDKSDTWVHPGNAQEHFSGTDSVFVSNALPMVLNNIQESIKTGNWNSHKSTIDALVAFQYKYGKNILPSEFKVKSEVLYNNLNIFQRLSNFYGLIGFVLLILQFIAVFFPSLNLKGTIKIAFLLIFACFIVHFLGLGLRWYVSGHAPWSNGYESMIYIGFATIFAGIVFYRKTPIALSATAVLTWIILHVAHLSWMDPEITNLVPVLRSYWLVLHVAIITASYGFLALGALLAFISLLFMIFQTVKNDSFVQITIEELTAVIQMSLIIGLYMLTIGTFLGGIWANESWGRYWGWDSKETWALITILWYALVSHLRMIPGFKDNLIYTILALLSFATVLMTYFGVNYYLTGLHSYAKGDSAALPSPVYYTLIIIGVIIFLAIVNQKMVLKKKAIP